MLRRWTSEAVTLRRVARRGYAIQTPGRSSLQVFDRRHKWLQKERAAANPEASRRVDYLRDEVATRLADRLLDINRTFDHVLDLGANSCNIARAFVELASAPPPAQDVDAGSGEVVGGQAGLDGARAGGEGTPSQPPAAAPASKVARITAVDSSPTLLHRDADLPFNAAMPLTREALDPEDPLPYAAGSFDAVLSSLSMHWVNDLPALLREVNRVLKPDAPFIAAMMGGDSLYELRTSLQLADLERRGGVSARTSPLADVRDVGGLLQSANFKLLTVDVDDIVVDYPSVFELMADLQAMGEANAVAGREGPIPRDVLLSADAVYRALHGNEDGNGVPATFRMIYLIGWKEGPNQKAPEKRGSAQVDMRDVLGTGADIKP